jgi:hypothetical protein
VSGVAGTAPAMAPVVVLVAVVAVVICGRPLVVGHY